MPDAAPPDGGPSGHTSDELARLTERAKAGNRARSGDKLAAQNKLFVRERLDLLLDKGSFVEDALLANTLAEDLPADGVVTGVGRIDGRPVCVMANDPTVKAGSWGARTVEKIVRLTEYALRHEVPVFWLVDSAGARITDQVELFPGRRGAGRIFYNQVRLSGRVPQICCLFGPSAAGGAYIPSFCDVVFMVEGNASMYLGSPRMAEMVIGEVTSLEEMGGARMHATVSGCGDNLVVDDEDALDAARAWFAYFPQRWRDEPPRFEPRPPARQLTAAMVPAEEHLAYDVHDLIDALVDAESFFERMPLFAPEVVTGLGLMDGRPVGVVANNPAQKGGVLFVDSADKAARFVWLCDAFNIPLVFLADVPGFMVGTEVERAGIIRHGAKMVTAVSEATVPKVSVIVRKAYGAGLYAMSGPAFEPEATLALPTARIAVMGPEAAVNAVYANRIAAIDDEAERESFVAAERARYEADVDLYRLASELVVDAVVDFGDLRDEIVRRLELASGKDRAFSDRRHGVPPV
ncbi:MAG TPA: acyl-CoA carboxylase subunit beta [Acidimicrobiales bacterium]|nr:acyl-CoA carboxylase subunit beta [Acidimicrobiales bacterium]